MAPDRFLNQKQNNIGLKSVLDEMKDKISSNKVIFEVKTQGT